MSEIEIILPRFATALLFHTDIRAELLTQFSQQYPSYRREFNTIYARMNGATPPTFGGKTYS